MKQLLIVGAGPVGMILAALLAKHGIKPVIIDKRKVPSNLPRGIAINQCTLATLEAIGVLPAILDVGIPVPRLNIYRGIKKMAELSFARLGLECPYFFHVRQSQVEEILAARLKDLGIEIQYQWKLTGLHDDGHQAIVEIETSNATTVLATDLVVGCDGGSSTCCEVAAISVSRESYGGFFRLADLVLRHTPWPQEETHYVLTKHGYLMLVPAPRGETRVIASFRGDLVEAERNDALTSTSFERLIADRTGYKVRIEKLLWTTQGPFGQRVATRARAGRMILAGDALHQFSPIGGTNMNVGIADADALASAILTKSLDAYEANRLAVVRHQLEMTRYLTRVMAMPHGMAMPARPFRSRTLVELFAHELPRLLTGIGGENSTDALRISAQNPRLLDKPTFSKMVVELPGGRT